MFKNMIKAIKRLFVDGRPPHHLPGASSLEYEHGSSQFFVTTQAEFEMLEPTQVQEIFRHRHILVPGNPPLDFTFDEEGLSRLGSLTAPREIQGAIPCSRFMIAERVDTFLEVSSKRSKRSNNNMLHKGSLASLLRNGDSKHHILNVLDLPMGGGPVLTPPQYR